MGDNAAAGWRLRRLVLAREKVVGVTIATRGSGASRPIRGVTLAAVRKHLPEFQPKVARGNSELAQNFRSYLEEIDDRLRGLARGEADAAIDETVRPQLDELRQQDNQTLEMLNDLAEKVAISLRPIRADKST